MPTDSQSGYTEPTTPNLYLDAEETGRQEGGVDIVRQRVADPVVAAAVGSLLAAVDGLEGKDYATQATLAAVLTELGPKLEPGDLVGLATQTTAAAIRDRLPLLLDNGSLDVADTYTAGETLASQVGPGVLTFAFADPVDLVWVRSVGGVSFADPFGGTPADGTGVYIADDEPTPLTVRASAVKVWAPSGAAVFVWGYGS